MGKIWAQNLTINVKKTLWWKFPAVTRGNEINNQQQRFIMPFKKILVWFIWKITILDIFGPNLGSKWVPKSAEKYFKNVIFVEVFRIFGKISQIISIKGFSYLSGRNINHVEKLVNCFWVSCYCQKNGSNFLNLFKKSLIFGEILQKFTYFRLKITLTTLKSFLSK